MSSPRSSLVKIYVDRGVQTHFTSEPTWLARSLSGSTKGSSTRTNIGSLAAQSYNGSNYAHSRSSSQLDNAYSHSLSFDSPSPVRSTKITRRVFERQKPPYSRPPGLRKPQSRTVSLPENPGFPRKREFGEPKEHRVVSLPNNFSSSPLVDQSASSDHLENTRHADQRLFSEDEKKHTNQGCNRPLSVDASHTPSLNSSSESIFIVENSTQMSETFLRDPVLSGSQRLFADEEGWITWATSPPRPIPALHGPLSLPYARCPSGAEGTIIEEHDDLPRMIWGMGADDTVSTHSRIGFHDPRQTTHSTKTSYVSYTQAKAAPRPQAKKLTYLATPQQTHISQPNPRNTLSTNSLGLQDGGARQRVAENIGQPHHHGDAITLGHMLRDGTAKLVGTWDQLYGTPQYQNLDSTTAPEQPFYTSDGIASEWQSSLAESSYRTPKVENRQGKRFAHPLKPSAPVFIPSNQTSLVSYPRIFVGPRSTESSRMAVNSTSQQSELHPPRILHNLNGLPTPPSSTSPQWSSNFSPYQASVYSPVLPAQTVGQSTSSSGQRSGADSSNELRKFVYERIGSRTNKKKKEMTITSTNQNDQAMHPGTFISGSPINALNFKYMRHISSPSTVSAKSPPYPGPPPSTPLPALPPSPIVDNLKSRNCRSSFSTTPPSPTSPEAHSRPRSVSYQQPRSVPLARLIQRRLSSVPEEDLSSRVRSPSPPPSNLQSNASHVQKYRTDLTPDVTREQYQSQIARTPSPVHTSLKSQSRIGSGYDREDSFDVLDTKKATKHVAAKVNLPLATSSRKGTRHLGESNQNYTRSEDRSKGKASKKRGKAKRDKMTFNTEISQDRILHQE